MLMKKPTNDLVTVEGHLITKVLYTFALVLTKRTLFGPKLSNVLNHIMFDGLTYNDIGVFYYRLLSTSLCKDIGVAWLHLIPLLRSSRSADYKAEQIINLFLRIDQQYTGVTTLFDTIADDTSLENVDKRKAIITLKEELMKLIKGTLVLKNELIVKS